MGKATNLARHVSERPLTAAEIEVRDDAASPGGQRLETTLDGQIVERATPTATPRSVERAATRSWD